MTVISEDSITRTLGLDRADLTVDINKLSKELDLVWGRFL